MSLNTVNKETGELITTANGTRIWCGTKTAHDLAVQQGTMPNNCMVCITDDAAGEEAWEYSTSETNTGKKWIDGKPIYRKVVEVASLPNNTQITYSHGIVNADSFVTIRGIAKSTTMSVPIPFLERNGTANIQIYAEEEGFVIATNFDASPYAGTIILEYTKSTD